MLVCLSCIHHPAILPARIIWIMSDILSLRVSRIPAQQFVISAGDSVEGQKIYRNLPTN